MVEVFLKILNMSITASYVFIAVLIIRLLLRRAPKQISYILWGVLLFRLICPVSFSSAFSLFNFFNVPVADSGGIEYISKGNGFTVIPQINSDAGYFGKTVNPVVTQAVEIASVNPMQVFLSIIAWVWLAGMGVMLIYSVVSYLRLKRRVSTATLLNGNIFETEVISSPFVCGFFRPKIYLPAGINEMEREYVLLHEQAHILRKDHIVKPIAFFTLSIHWFNPLMWVAFCLMSRDMEMSCDEQVICELDHEGKARYGETLLRLAIKSPILAGSPLAFGESTTKSRIKNVLHYKKPAFWIVCLAVLAAAIGTIFLLANPAQSLDLPDANSVLSLEMEQFNEGVSVGSLVITDAERIETILSAMTGTKKTLRHSVNDNPAQDNYLVVRLILGEEMRTLCLYSENGSEYIEEPYGGIYKSSSNLGNVLYRIYTGGLEHLSGGAANIRWEVSADVPKAVKDYAMDYVRGEIDYYNSLGCKISDAKITALTCMNTGTPALTKAVEMWLLEYRLLPGNADKLALAGGMKMEDRWLTEWGSTGQPLLVVVCDWDTKTKVWRRVGTTNTLRVQEEYQGDYTTAMMAMYHELISRTGIAWEYMPAGSVLFPALGIRLDIPFNKVHVSVDRGTLYLNDETQKPNYIGCGKETDYPAGECILWSPSEGDVFGSGDVANGCMLHLEISAGDGKIHKGIILIEQSHKEDGMWIYKVSLTQTDTGLILVKNEEYDGGGILKLP